jgi:hypothetical protein
MGETSQALRWVAIPKTRKIRYKVGWSIRSPLLTSVRLWSWTVCRMAAATVTMRGGFPHLLGFCRMLRYSIDKNGKKPPTRLNITSVVSLPFLLLLFEVVRYSEIRILVFAPPGRLCGRLTMVEGRAKTGMKRHRLPCARFHSQP